MKNIHIGSVIKQKVKESSMSIKEFAERISCERSTVYDIYERKSIDTELLIRISEALNFDFFSEIYFNKKTTQFSKKILIAFEIEEENIANIDLPDGFLRLFTQD